MNRRQFLGASFAAAIASFCLPFEQFAEWCNSWLRRPKWTLEVGDYFANFEVGMKLAGPGFGTITAIDRARGLITVG